MSIGVDLKGRIALVTGSSRGIGRAVALALAEAGADVAVNYRARAREAAEVVKVIEAAGRRSLAVAADVSVGSQVRDMVASIERDLGPVDVLVNNAGLAIPPRDGVTTEDDFDRTIAVNVKSVFLVTETVLPGMRERKWGRIVNLSSVAARAAGAVGPAYNAAKAGVEGLTRGYAARVAREGITVNAVAPGPTDTEMGDFVREGVAARVPVGRMGTPEEMAQAVLMVVGNAYMTGQTIPVNGGLSFI